jgi:hypothetical protein
VTAPVKRPAPFGHSPATSVVSTGVAEKPSVGPAVAEAAVKVGAVKAWPPGKLPARAGNEVASV